MILIIIIIIIIIIVVVIIIIIIIIMIIVKFVTEVLMDTFPYSGYFAICSGPRNSNFTTTTRYWFFL